MRVNRPVRREMTAALNERDQNRGDERKTEQSAEESHDTSVPA